MQIAQALMMFICMSVLGSAVAYADVTGSFQTEISLTPLPCAGFICKKEPFTVSLASRLRLAVTLGGAAFEFDGSMGITGPEYFVLDFRFDLGLRLKDRLIFATPFGRAKAATGERVPVAVVPRELLLVRQEAVLEYPWSGMLLSSLLVFEDMAFPSPLASPRKSYSGHNQIFGFGATFSLKGGMPSGTHIESVTSFCFDPAKRKNIIKRSFTGKVCEEGSLNFAEEMVTVRDLSILPGLKTDHEMTCRPQEEALHIECTVESGLDTQPIPVMLAISTDLTLNDLLSSGSVRQVELQAAYGPLLVEFTWNGMLALKRVDATVHLAKRASEERSLEWTLSGTFVSDSGFTRLKSVFTLRQARLMFKADATLSKSNGLIKLTESNLELVADIGPIQLEFSADITVTGLRQLALGASVQF